MWKMLNQKCIIKSYLIMIDGGNDMVTAKEAYKIMDEYIRKNPDDKITRMVEIDDSYVFGTKNHPSYGEMAIRKADGSIYIIHIVDYAEHVGSGDVVEIDITNGFKKMQIAS